LCIVILLETRIKLHQWSDLNGVTGISRVKGWFGCSSNSSKDKSADVEGKREEENRNQNEATGLEDVESHC